MKDRKKAKKLLRAMTDIDDRYLREAERFGKDEKESEARRKKLNIRRTFSFAAVAAVCMILVVIDGRFINNGNNGPVSVMSEDAATADSSDAFIMETQGDVTAVSGSYIEASSLSEAEEIAGFNMSVPEPSGKYDKAAIAVLDGNTIEVTYYNGDSGTSGYTVSKTDTSDIYGDSSDSLSPANPETSGGGAAAEASESSNKETSGNEETQAAAAEDDSEYPVKTQINVNGKEVTLLGKYTGWYIASWTSGGYEYTLNIDDQSMTRKQIEDIISVCE